MIIFPEIIVIFLMNKSNRNKYNIIFKYSCQLINKLQDYPNKLGSMY